MKYWISFFLCLLHHTAMLGEVPVYYEGRIRPLSAVSDTLQEDLLLLPGKEGLWYPLSALASDTNMTRYPDSLFQEMRSLLQNEGQLIQRLEEGYLPLAGMPFLKSPNRTVYYPHPWALRLEAFYVKTPLVLSITILYALAFLLLLWKRRWGYALFVLAFLLHTALLLMRSTIVARPPVATMYETCLFVPWIIALIGGVFATKTKLSSLLPATSGTSCAFLFLLPFLAKGHELENVPPVLHSSFWLTIHVLLVVASYGAFALASILGHITLFQRQKSPLIPPLFWSLCIGLLLLMAGTLLGGVWAAQSWGRFWDWDPKESWAFISCCTYLIGIHAYRYHWIRERGLAALAIVGFLVITFTWYGVNYLLGTVLHSYGFGSGGTLYYLAFLLIEMILLGYFYRRDKGTERTKTT